MWTRQCGPGSADPAARTWAACGIADPAAQILLFGITAHIHRAKLLLKLGMLLLKKRDLLPMLKRNLESNICWSWCHCFGRSSGTAAAEAAAAASEAKMPLLLKLLKTKLLKRNLDSNRRY